MRHVAPQMRTRFRNAGPAFDVMTLLTEARHTHQRPERERVGFVNDADRVLRPLRAAESSELRVESSELKGVDGGATGVDEQAL